ncbi:MAG: 50S ribosomal protein L29 [Candidatus Tectomicrobia bacterium]|nr:50S ribosomal protein L29 [Candidatus Tectomicrobia bacterium]
MKPQQFRDLTEDELAAKERELREELFNLRFQRATGRVENPMRVRQVRRDIARARTIARQRTRARKG